MDKQIPIYFSSIILGAPSHQFSIGEYTGSELKVGAFYKYENQNGSYITDEIAEELIKSATTGDIPIVGFFDRNNQEWASHTGPSIANGYGYIGNFEGWQPIEDRDGVTRDYAVFNVILFTKYFPEANKILGMNQSMELDPRSITGRWKVFGNKEYYVYDTAKIRGFCVIGSHEPCFSASSFFSKQDEDYKEQFEEFSSLLKELKSQVEEINSTKGGESPMDPAVNPNPVDNQVPAPAVDQAAFEALQAQYSAAQNDLASVRADFEAAQATIADLESFRATAEADLQTLREQNAALQASVANYEAIAAEHENNRKATLINQYASVLAAEEVEDIRNNVNNFSYDELRSKLAITFAEKQFANKNEGKVPLPDAPKDQFALLMGKYRKK